MSEWIKFSERLPEIGIQVLCYGIESSNIHDLGLPYKTGIYDGKHWISDHFCESSYLEVTHWMKLPEPPE